MFKRLRKPAAVALAIAGVAAALVSIGLVSPASAADPINYTFRFVNGTTLTGTATDKNHFLADAGGSSADNPTGMTVHLSCSDKFSGGWGDKEGPVQGVDTAWQIDSYFIQKGSKTCGTPTPPPPPADPPAIDIEKFVNGQDADSPTGPEIPIGGKATFTYEVTNTGGIPLRNVDVTDSTLGPIGCPKTELAVGESMFCDEKSKTVTKAGQFTMKATVTAIGDVLSPGLPSPLPEKAEAARFTFVNGKTVVRVTDKKDEFFPEVGGTSVDNPTGVKIHLSCSDKFPGGWGEKDGPTQGVDTAWQIESFSIGKIKKGQFELKCGSPFVVPSEEEVMDMDPVHYIVPPPDPKIDIEKFVNGEDADNPPGPTIPAGSTAKFTYKVTNPGDVTLYRIMVTDNVVGAISCPRGNLAPGQSMDCQPTEMVAEPGQQTMEACVKGFSNGRQVDDCDPVYYEVPPPPEPPTLDCKAAINKYGVRVKWNDIGAKTYEVWRDGERIGTTTNRILVDFDPKIGKRVSYQVVALFADWKVVVDDCGKVKVPYPPNNCDVNLKLYNHTDGRVEVRKVGPDGETSVGYIAPGKVLHAYGSIKHEWKVYSDYDVLTHYKPGTCGEHFVLITRH